MGERGKSIAAEKFSCDRHLKNTLELYDELLSKRKSAPSQIGHEWRLNELEVLAASPALRQQSC